MTIRTVSAGALLALVAIAANACGDDSDPDVGTGGQAGAATTGGRASGGTGTGGTSGMATGGKSTGGNPSGGNASGGNASGGKAQAGAGGAMAGEGGVGTEPGGSGGVANGGSSGEGGANEGGFAGVPSEPKGGPLLEGPSTSEYECKATQALAVLKAPTPAHFIPSATPVVVWTSEPMSGNPKSGVYWSEIAESGGLAETKVIKEGEFRPTYVSAVTNGARTTVVWDESGESDLSRLSLAQVDASGDVVSEPRPLFASAQPQSAPVIVAAGDGYALVWIEFATGEPSAWFARLDASGDIVGTPRTLDIESTSQVPGLIAIGDGFALTYLARVSGMAQGFLAALDADGDLRRAPVPLGGYYASQPDLLVRDGKLLAAWTHVTGGYDNSDIATTIRIGWFDANGNPIGDTYQLQSPVEDEENVDPHWAEIGDDLGLIWGRGSVIYICAGCIPDERLEFVVLDGESFEPRSELVTIENMQDVGGLLRPELAVNGPDLRVFSAVTYHTSGAVGTARIRCE